MLDLRLGDPYDPTRRGVLGEYPGRGKVLLVIPGRNLGALPWDRGSLPGYSTQSDRELPGYAVDLLVRHASHSYGRTHIQYIVDAILSANRQYSIQNTQLTNRTGRPCGRTDDEATRRSKGRRTRGYSTVRRTIHVQRLNGTTDHQLRGVQRDLGADTCHRHRRHRRGRRHRRDHRRRRQSRRILALAGPSPHSCSRSEAQ